MSKMPVKAHVKGKRKAPPPPPPLSQSATSSPKPVSSDTRIRTASESPSVSRLTPDQKAVRKKPAPSPPLTRFTAFGPDTSIKQSLNIDDNNLSSANSKFPVKNYENKPIFNLNELNGDTRVNERQLNDAKNLTKGEPVLLKYKQEVHFDNNHDIRNDIDGVRGNGNDGMNVWVCQYCTLENAFWKIVCAACDRIKPYGLPLLPLRHVDNDQGPDDTPNPLNNTKNEVKLRRPKKDTATNDLSKENRSSLNIDPYAVCSVEIDKNSEEKANKRQSVNISKENDFTMNTLEMEKQRLRAVIRSMNNQALAARYPNQNEVKINNIDAVSADRKKHTYEKINDFDQDVIKNNLEKNINAKIDVQNRPAKVSASIQTDDLDRRSPMSLPPLRGSPQRISPMRRSSPLNSSPLRSSPQRASPIRNSPKLQLDLSKNIPPKSPKPGCSKNLAGKQEPMKVQNDQNKIPDTYYDFIGNLAMYCDQSPLSGTMKKLEKAIENEKVGETTFVAMNVAAVDIPIEIDDGDSFRVNLYINFNNAIVMRVRSTMLLYDLRKRIFKEFVLSKNVKIYFNGLLIQRDDLTLDEYGMKEGSCLYVNTENVTVDVENVVKTTSKDADLPSTSKAVVLPHKIEGKSKNINQNNSIQKESSQKAKPKPQADQPPRDQYRIEHIQLNRILIERVNPDQFNAPKTKYRGVYNYNPRFNPEALIEIENQKLASSKTKVAPKKPTNTDNAAKDHYLELLTLDNSNDIALNSEPFECPVCIVPYEPYEGIVLRNCLHTFCRDCVKQTIIHSDEAEVKCPFMDATYTCESLLQDREIKGLLTKEEHDEHLAKSLRVAEHKIENSFHCRTPNCKGWCIYEDNVNQFKCPICSLVNCMTCRVIHDGLDCKQYQDLVKSNIEGNPENAITKNMLEEMIQRGEAMNCPTCRVVLMKKWGCDWLKCSMCKAEICWVTRGPRWGPDGKGDTSGGCKCGVNGVKCHPKCNYCH